MSIVYFKEEKHHYFNHEGQRYESVSGLWKPCSKPFVSEDVAIKKAFKALDFSNYNDTKRKLSYDHPDFIEKLFDNTDLNEDDLHNEAASYIKQWDDKRDLGTAFHAKEEQQDLDRGFRINHFTGVKAPIVKWDIEEGWDNQSCPGSLMDLPDGYIPEHLVKSDKYGLAGQIDQNFIETVKGIRYIDIDDWKTDAKVLIKPDFFHPKKGYAKLNFPFDHIFDTNYWKYCLKISTYANMLEQEGFVVRNLAFTHVVIDENLEIVEQKQYKVPYKKFEVEMRLASFK